MFIIIYFYLQILEIKEAVCFEIRYIWTGVNPFKPITLEGHGHSIFLAAFLSKPAVNFQKLLYLLLKVLNFF